MSDLKKRIAGWVETDKRIFAYQSDKKRSTVQESIYHKPNDQTDALGTGHTPKVINVFGQANGINTPAPSTKNTLENATQETSEQLTLMKSQTTTSYAEVFLAKVSRLLVKGEDLKILEELCSLKLQGLSKLKDLNYCSWKTSKD